MPPPEERSDEARSAAEGPQARKGGRGARAWVTFANLAGKGMNYLSLRRPAGGPRRLARPGVLWPRGGRPEAGSVSLWTPPMAVAAFP